MTSSSDIWTYRGRRLKPVEWGLWKDMDRKHYYFLCYRPEGRGGPCVRRWVWTGGPSMTITDLKDFIRAERAKIEARKLGQSPRLATKEARDEYLAELARRNRTASHISGVTDTLKRFIADAPVRMDLITVRDAERFLSSAGGAPRTLNRHRAHLSGWFEWAMKRQYITLNPARMTTATTEGRTLPVFPTPEGFIALVDALPSRYDTSLWTLLAFTGLRKGSVLSLTPECFRKDGILVPHTKRRREWFLSYDDGCPLWGPDLSRLGRAIWKTEPVTAKSFRDRFETVPKVNGKRYTSKSCRHAFCSWLVMMGESMSDVAAWAHHSTPTTTAQWYAHLRPRGRARTNENREGVLTARSHAFEKALPGLPQHKRR